MNKKKVFYYLVVLSISLSRCGTLSGIKKPVALIDFPSDLVVKNKETGEILPIETGVIGSTSSYRTRNNTTTVTNYVGQAVRFKPQKNITLELTSKGVTKTIEISKKNNVGMLILEGVFSLGTFAVVDLITGGHKSPNPPFIDVKALFENKEQRSSKEMIKYIKQNSQ